MPTPSLRSIAFLLACATNPERRCAPTCPGYFVNGDTNTVERCDECAVERGYADLADDDLWEAVLAVQAIAGMIPADVTPETLTEKRLLAIDEEYGPPSGSASGAWWTAARAVADPGFVATLAQLEAHGDDLLVPVAQAEAFLAIAASLPAWDQGPDHAPHPIFVAER